MLKIRPLRHLCLNLIIAFLWSCLVASYTQAAGHWYLSGAKTTSTVKVEAELPKGQKIALLTTLAGGTTVELSCSKFQLTDGLLFTNGSGLAILYFEECKTFLNGGESPPCKPMVPEVGVHALLVKHNSETYILFSPHNLNSLLFTKIHFGEECAVGEEIAITGHVVSMCVNVTNDCNVSETKKSIVEAQVGLFADGPLFSARPAQFDGGPVVFPSGAPIPTLRAEGLTVATLG